MEIIGGSRTAANIPNRNSYGAETFVNFVRQCPSVHTGSQIIPATNGIFRSSMVSAQLPESVPTNTIAALTPAGNAGS